MQTLLNRNSWLQQLYFGRNKLEKALILSSLFSGMLLLVRIILTSRMVFLFLPWNLFLAWTPYLLSKWMATQPAILRRRAILFLCMATWLLIVPNSFYILTDLFHLQMREESNRGFDLVLIFSFAWTGLALGVLSVGEMGKICRQYFSIRHDAYFIFPVMWMISLGIYIGRYMRFNSWDVITNPFALLSDIGDLVLHPAEHIIVWGMIGCFAVLMTIIYYTVKFMAKSL